MTTKIRRKTKVLTQQRREKIRKKLTAQAIYCRWKVELRKQKAATRRSTTRYNVSKKVGKRQNTMNTTGSENAKGVE
jgi:hypothetical protein